MKYLYVLIFVILSFAITDKVLSKANTVHFVQAPIVPKVESNTPTDTWLKKLAKCESGGNWKALNPIDRDGTPSKGKFQFKDNTFNFFSKAYGIATTSIWNGDEQEKIVRKMILDKSVNFKQQFPDCVRKIGLPPGRS